MHIVSLIEPITEVTDLNMDKAWFSDRVREQEAGMYALAMSYMKQEADALDCMQQSILKAYEHLDSLRDPERFKSWLFGILVNCCRDELRRKKRRDIPEEAPGAVSAPEDSMRPLETKTVLRDAVDALSEPYRTVVILFYYEDLPTAEIAEALGEHPDAVRKQLSRARDLLRARLVKEEFQDE